MGKEDYFDNLINFLEIKTKEILGEKANAKDLIRYKEYLSFVIENMLEKENVKYFNDSHINIKLTRIMRFLISKNYSEIIYEINDLFNYIRYNESENKVPMNLILINLHLTLTKGLSNENLQS